MTDYLRQHRHGEKMLVSLGSLSHYVQELSAIGVHVRDVVHEGNGDLWAAALDAPRFHVGWILMEELSEGGDVLAERAREYPEFLRGFTRVAEGGGVALYRRAEEPTAIPPPGSPSPGSCDSEPDDERGQVGDARRGRAGSPRNPTVGSSGVSAFRYLTSPPSANVRRSARGCRR